MWRSVFYNHRQLEAGSASCRFVVFKSSDRPPPPDSWGSIGVGRSPPIANTNGTKKGSTMKLALDFDPHGYDAGKKRQRRRCAEIKGKKRHILVDTLGLLLHAIVHPADIQDRDGGMRVMATLFGMFPFLKTLFADSGYQGQKFAKALAKVLPHLDVEIVKRSDRVSGFVGRTIAWLNRCRRLAKDWECLNRKALAFLRLAAIRLLR